jgi:type II secretory pathway component PulK
MRNRSRRGMILLVVLVVIALCAMAAITFSELMMAEREAANIAVRKAQVRMLADSGLEAARMFLGQTPDLQKQGGGVYDNPGLFRGILVTQGATARNCGRFTIVAPRIDEGGAGGVRFGLEDESTKLNLNILASLDQKLPGSGRQILMGLPGMTEEIADAILDWIDQDDEKREFGAEIETYSATEPGYAPRNGPLTTVEELLLVYGVTPTLLFGVDANRNGMADRGEPDPQTVVGADNSDHSMDRGWAAYLTLYSMESNLQPDGVTPRINLNQTDMQQLYTDLEAVLGAQAATFIVAYRQNGPVQQQGQSTPTNPSQNPTGWNTPAPTGTQLAGRSEGGLIGLHPLALFVGVLAQPPTGGSGGTRGGGGVGATSGTGTGTPGRTSGGGSGAGSGAASGTGSGGASGSSGSTTSKGAAGELDLTQPGKVSLKNVLELIGAQVQVKFKGQNQATTLDSPFPNDPAAMGTYLPTLLDYVTTNPNKTIPGRININQAPRVVLQGIPGMTPDILDQIMSQRQSDPAQRDDTQRYETWLLSKGIVDLEQMKALLPFVCAGGCIYRVQVVGYFDADGPEARIEAVIHAGSQPPRVIFWRDISHLGRGYPLELLGAETVAGE